MGKRISKVNEHGRKKPNNPAIEKPHGNVKVHGNFKEINWKEVQRRIEVGTSGTVIAKCLRIDPDTFFRRFKEEYGMGFAEYTVGMSACLPANILLAQYMKAMSGSADLLKLLGREYLGQGRDEDPASKKLAEKFDDTVRHLADLFSGVKQPELPPEVAKSHLKMDESKMSKDTKS